MDPAPVFAWAIGEVEGSMLAGFLEGELHLGIAEQNGGQSYSCLAQLNVRDDDVEILEWLVALTGIGSLHRVPARRTSKPQVQWRVVSMSDCRELAAVLARFPLYGRKRRELDVWTRAVDAWAARATDRRPVLRRMKHELQALRRYAPAERPLGFEPRSKQALWGYISGFLLAEAHFRLTESDAGSVVRVRADDVPLLDLLAGRSGLGKVRIYASRPPLNPVAMWTVASRRDLSLLGSWLLEVGLPDHKGRLMRIWADAVGKLDRPSDRRVAARRLAAARVYVQPPRRELLAVVTPDLRQRCLDALKSWASDERGRLSCLGYMRWRADRKSHPARNTIAGQFGSWQGALEAAGLGDRVARAPRPAGGGERRRRRRREQQGRVVAAVRRFERERGRLPRAVEFFRWRYEAGVDAPTQGTVYKLFPGGWTEVLERARQVAEATV